MIKKSFTFLFFLLIQVYPVFGTEVEDYSPTVNTRGLTGYYYLDSAGTLLKGEIQTSLFGIAYQEDVTRMKKGTAEAVLSAGVLDGVETSIGIPYYRQSGNLAGLGDIRWAGKVHLLDQMGEDIPELAAVVSVIFPTGDQNNGFRTVNSYGADLLLVAQAIIDLNDYAFNLNAEGGVFAQDIGQASEEKHVEYGMGGYFPLADAWVLLLEGNGTIKNGLFNTQDSLTASASLRLFTGNFSMTGGVDKTIAMKTGAPEGLGLHGSLNFFF
jgi:hypothetical protein